MFKLLKTPDLVSLTNLTLGIFSIFLLVIGDTGFQPVLSIAASLLLLAAVADGVDGWLARRTQGGPLGEHIDSLADAVSFGVGPAVLVLAFSKTYGSFETIVLSAAVGTLYILCGIFRLARYNAFHTPGRGYEGIPITGASVGISVLAIFAEKISLPYGSFLLITSLLIFSFVMVSTLPFPKIRKSLTFKFLIVVFSLTVLSSPFTSVYACIAPGILTFLMLMYLLSPVLTILRKKKSV